MDGDRVEGSDKEAHERHPEKRCLCEKRHRARRETEKKQRIDQRIGMIQNEDDRSGGRDEFGPRGFDAAKENVERQTENGAEKTVKQESTPIGK